MNRKCVFCRQNNASALLGALALCPACRKALISVSPARPEYQWFMRAVRLSLFHRAA